jgi:NAD dependent epimerase/dehydratase family enzyme
VRAAFGQMGREALLASVRARPARLLAAGFKFRFADLDAAFSHLLGGDNHRGNATVRVA